MRHASLPVLLALGLLTLAQVGCGGGNPDLPQGECEDGVDNDHDSLVDQEDPSCAAGHDNEADDPVTKCSNDFDDDGDGKIDYPEDPGCDSTQDNDEIDFGTAECNDGEDNDGDGKIDYPDDPGCFSALQNDESDDCPDGARCPQCANGVDDDDDGMIDFPDDPGCTAASDDQEQAANPAACDGNTFEQLPQDGLVYATIGTGNQSLLTSTVCGGTGPEKIYEFFVHDPSVMVASTDLAGTVIDTVLYVRSECSNSDTEVSCNDNAANEAQGSSLTAIVQPGFYYLIVDAKNASELGAFQMRVDFYPGVGDPCDPDVEDACAPGLVCRIVDDNPGPTCEGPVCNDGRDDDADGTPDYPNDPGCNAPGDGTEDDDCPDGPNCPGCANTVDDDGDGQIDFPDDTGCHAASQPLEGCGTEQDPIGQITDDHTNGTTVGAHDDQIWPSGCSWGFAGPDNLYTVHLPQAVDSLTVDTLDNIGSTDTVVYVEDASCSGNFYGCSDNYSTDTTWSYGSKVVTGPLPAGTYAVVVDSYDSSWGVGPYDLHVQGIVPANAPCTDDLFAQGILSCAPGAACDGSICVPALCNNGIDDDGDGPADFPNDPGCTDTTDNDESDPCPGSGCPACYNDVDDDSDGQIDFPGDLNCVSANDGTEGCEQDITQAVTSGIMTGTTGTAHPDFTLSCGFGTDAGNDRSYALSLPVTAASLTIDTVGSNFDTVIALKTPACDPTDLFCDDDGGGFGNTSRLVLSNLAAGNYIIVVDGYNGSTGGYALNVHGLAAPGSACTSPLFAAGVLACSPGQSCVSGVCQ